MYDIAEPRNLEEEDLYEDMVELPPSRPETELTQLLYSIVLTRVRKTHAKVVDLMSATTEPPYRDIMELDSMLRHVYERVPESTKAMPAENFDDSISPSSMRRLYLGLSFLKAELVLHRPYVILGRRNTKYEYSRRVCLNAALEMLDFQRRLDSEIRPGGKLWLPGWQIFTVSWSMSSVVAQDFLLATTILILDLGEDLVRPLPATNEIARSGLRADSAIPTREEMINALVLAQHIWHKASKRSHEARKVAGAVRLVLRKAGVSEEILTSRLGSESIWLSKAFREGRQLTGFQAANAGLRQPDLMSATSMDMDDFSSEAPSSEPFTMSDQYYSDAFAFESMGIDLGELDESFNWVRVN